uniref:Zasp-like motif domain-containing protein n=1 Tax=Glossina brevipalpis TaxID=37001 RepID=A0A1A9WG47_9MUSC
QQYRAPSYETHQQFQNPIQPQYSPLARSNQNQYQQPSQFEQQQQYQQPPWMQSQQRQFQPQPQPYQAPQYQPPLNQYQTISIQSQPNQFTTQTNQSYNFNSQPQQQLQQQTVPPHDQTDHRHLQQQQPLSQDYRSSSPGVITLRKEAPLSQRPTPVYISQPAANILKGGSNMRGDLKWPPPEYKEAAARENEERRQIAKGPAFRPRKTHRDYSAFFAKNALSHHYPSYKVPPGTQHIMAK